MLEVKSENGIVEIMQMDGREKTIVADVGAIANKVLLLAANEGSKTKEEVYIRYGVLARQLVNYIDKTVNNIDKLGGKQDAE
ncbi:hypothetical protein C8E03_108163 [Lachnotalea glycerini]|uniref:Uncharacterized protein n=1 Tax=Lachnotalea glycerini TaxID=1763509 RepID=A0A318ELM9_9FIRM|nr:hypothetical protein [Lachnotalea glycerini]PXV88436.1 hypothetical protein C8E03_108163 [Lachnotalea glycerini]